MAIEEMVESQVKDIGIRIIESGASLIVRVGADSAKGFAAAGWRIVTGGAGMITDAIRHQMETGKVSEARLQSMGKDVHDILLPDESLKEVTKSLRKAGITYSVETTGQGSYYLHFQGKDQDHLLHAVNRAFEQVGLTLTTEMTTPDRSITATAPSETTAPERGLPEKQVDKQSSEPEHRAESQPTGRQSESRPDKSKLGKKTRADALKLLDERAAAHLEAAKQQPARTLKPAKKHNR
ncbi:MULTISPECIES: PcfB family protein [Bifidobacterium]|uniref:Mobilization protein n=2 Tax=Bifidobacterium TaxID=1678 RepID=A0A261FP03_9BIFI|nr:MULTISPECIES: PcfB family protein [Bifidobacterium]OZG60715.1 mobilization protein [Bifidobacterium lemurum]OZG69613.1 mobilization protein [Bifidobacterium eulemuris]QOL32270.1 DUF3801 domain-containing protein [Bifidobacterium eulemuris]QOL35230.1 DUF3801 domain-containing protein [Bifidobacterium lemurum]